MCTETVFKPKNSSLRPYIACCDHEIVCPSWPITVSHCTTFFIYHPKSCSLQRLVNLAHIRGLKPTIVHKCQEKHLFITWLNFLLGQRPGSMDILACDAQRGIDYICQLLKGVELKRLFNMVTIKMIHPQSLSAILKTTAPTKRVFENWNSVQSPDECLVCPDKCLKWKFLYGHIFIQKGIVPAIFTLFAILNFVITLLCKVLYKTWRKT